MLKRIIDVTGAVAGLLVLVLCQNLWVKIEFLRGLFRFF